MPLLPEAKNCDPSVKKNFRRISKELGYTGNPTFANNYITNVITAGSSVFSKTCTVAAGLNVLRVTGLQTDDIALTGTLRGAYIDVSNGSTEATGTIRALELKARTEAPGDTGSKVAVLEGLSISADSKAHDVTTMRAAEFILDGKTAGTINEMVGLRIANNLQFDKATNSYGLQIYRDSFDYTYDISLSLGGHITGDSYVNQDLRTTASPTFVGGTFSAVVTGVTPTAGEHLATKEYIDKALGAHFDYFISDTPSGVGTNYNAYANETGDDESTLTTDPLGEGTKQLLFSWLTEAEEPGVEALREGVYIGHIHLHRGTGDKSCTAYWTVSKVDANGSSNKILVATSETSGEIGDSETHFVLRAVVADGVVIGKTQRLLFEIRGNIGGSGGPCEVTTTQEGTTDCHFSITLPSYVWQLQDDVLDDIAALTAVADNEFIVGTGVGTYAHENPATAATSMGLGTGDSPQFTGIELGHADDTTITRASAGNLNIEGNLVYRAGGTDVPIGDGGTGQSTAQAAIDALSAVSGATNEHVLTKDTASGNAIWKVAAGGGITYVDRGDLSACDFDINDFIFDSTWNELDLSSAIPSGTKFVLLSILELSGMSENVRFRKKGNNNEFNISSILLRGDETINYSDVFVIPDEDGIIEYYGFADTQTDVFNVTVSCYFV